MIKYILRSPRKAYYLFLLIILANKIIAQDSLSSINFNSRQNILAFADFLYCEKDYLRAISEYKKYLSKVVIDSIQFRIIKSYEYIGDFSQAENELNQIGNQSTNYFFFEKVILKYKQEDYSSLRTYFDNNKDFITANGQLYYLSYLLDSVGLPEKNIILSAFNNSNKQSVSEFYEKRINPGYKKPWLAGALSIIVPGSGKIYTGNIGDGITALIFTGLLSFISYDNFRANHPARGWIFGALSALFYAGNIYGSVTSANIYNSGIDYNNEAELKEFIKQNNYFIPENDIGCK